MIRFALAALLVATVLGCNDPELVETRPIVDYTPWHQGAWTAVTAAPSCRKADAITISADGREITCVWECALYWTPGKIGMYFVRVGWVRGEDGMWRPAPEQHVSTVCGPDEAGP